MQNLEEILREVCCLGDLEKIKVLVVRGVNVNSQNKVNGWTSLHWAAKRNHKHVVSYLLNNGADLSTCTFNKERALDLTQSKDIKELLGKEGVGNTAGEDSNHVHDHVGDDDSLELPASVGFVPNYIMNPQFPYSTSTTEFAQRLGIQLNPNTTSDISSGIVNKNHLSNNLNIAQRDQEMSSADEDTLPLVLKFRIAESDEKDFIEVELTRKYLSFTTLVDACLMEFGIEKNKLKKIRKLPNTIVKNDRDVKRLTQFQEMEIVLE